MTTKISSDLDRFADLRAARVATREALAGLAADGHRLSPVKTAAVAALAGTRDASNAPVQTPVEGEAPVRPVRGRPVAAPPAPPAPSA